MDALDIKEYNQLKSRISKEQMALLNSGYFFYELTFENKGGLVMPLIIKVNYGDESSEVIRIPAEVWRSQEDIITKVFILEKEVVSFQLDPYLETADTDLYNNSWPRRAQPSRFDLFEQRKMRMQQRENPMQRQKRVDQLQD